MVAARTRLDIATANLANVSTDGFRGFVARGRLATDGAHVERLISDAHGALRHTGRSFDLAIVGAGSFRVRAQDGSVRHTRAGSFTRDRDGYLRTDDGAALLGPRGRLRVAEGATVDARMAGLPAGSVVRAGFLETANVDAIGEMLHVIEAQRAFETAQKVVSAIDATRQKSASDVARLK